MKGEENDSPLPARGTNVKKGNVRYFLGMKFQMLGGVILNSRLPISERLELSQVKEETYRGNKDRGMQIAACTNDREKQNLREDEEDLEIDMTIR